MSEPIEADYLVVGGGAMGMAFADEIVHGSKAARVVVVDRRAKPGGHWNDAYRFVTLHQPALFYGLNSRALGAGGRDLVSQAQILAYYELVQKSLEATGRFTFLARCEADAAADPAEGVPIRSLIAAGTHRVVRARKIVDATYMDVQVPATTPPTYDVRGGARLVPINGLVDLPAPVERFVVIGAGKTGIDAVLHLLDVGVAPDAISWVMPNDAWMLNRDNIQPAVMADEFIDQMKVFHEAPDFDTILDTLERRARLLRLDPGIRPTKYRCATVTHGELDTLRRVGDVIRQGRVSTIDGATLHLAHGERTFAEPVPAILYVDCTADGLAPRAPRRIFEAERITLQAISMCQQVMSAAAIAALELHEPDDGAKNATVTPVPHPRLPADYVLCMSRTLANLEVLGRKLPVWSLTSRLAGVKHMPWWDLLRFAWAAYRYPPPETRRIEALVANRATTFGTVDVSGS